MTLNQLETFMAIVRMGSFAAAAAKLHMTQSAVSARIRELEASLGGQVFDRTKRKAHLTPTGRQLVHSATEMLSLGAEMRYIAGGPQAVSGRVRVGVAELIAVTWLPDFVSNLKEQYPRLYLELNIGLTVPIHAALRKGELDLALMPGQYLDPGLRAVSLGNVNFVWTAGTALKLPERTLSPRDLSQTIILTLGKDSYHHNIIDDWFARHPTRKANMVVCNSMSVLAALTIAGLGASLLPKFKYADEIASGALRELRTRPRIPNCEFFAVHIDDPPQPVARRIAELARVTSHFRR